MVLVLLLLLGGEGPHGPWEPLPPATLDVTHGSAPAPLRPPQGHVAPPRPKPKVTTSLAGRGPASWRKAWAGLPLKVERLAWCVAHHESWNLGLWTAVYPDPSVSTASGFAQWTDPTWRTQTKRAGVGRGYSRGMYAPPRVQALVFAYQVTHHGMYPWDGTGC